MFLFPSVWLLFDDVLTQRPNLSDARTHINSQPTLTRVKSLLAEIATVHILLIREGVRTPHENNMIIKQNQLTAPATNKPTFTQAPLINSTCSRRFWGNR